jgi:hypothetical protein
MIQSILFRRIVVAVIVAGMLGLLACEGSDPPVIVASENPPPKPDIVTEDGDIKGEVYASGHPYHEQAAAQWLRQTDVAGTIAAFEARGYELSPDGGCTVDVRDRTISTAVTFLALHGTGPSADRSVLVACYGVDGEPGLSAAEFSIDKPGGETGWRQIGDMGWIRTGRPAGVEVSAARFDELSWLVFWDCLMTSAPSTMIACAYACTYVGPGYWHCMLACAFTQTAIKVTACLIKTFLCGATNLKEDAG